ncbi:hypothetical protein [Actinosynnema mirum]|uniref:Esterase-like activity of phytase family protein n=1 Tax=Actinosynnema mirum (strain ATCC 29888 / DSM 43827 / JCM 3225 / NBRC 14064 / NCIMB 13271 / NRRL B-12336 / IMRU 3971 / 101) TaxID=446462 RepID=C6WAB9_ACTMD|nr:hypothetical protein Amir_1435 [Actinosynnema mirum DSM 43827]
MLPAVAALLLVTAGPAPAQPAVADVCRVTDPRLAELSGLASDGRRWYALNDDDGVLQVQVLGRDCSVVGTISGATDPYDAEDLALAPDGTLWVSDTGDNARSRSTVALHALSRDGTTRLYRLTYPDGPHDAEALLLDAAGVPHVVTKEALGQALVYRPVGALDEAAPTPLEQVAALSLPSTDTPGGPRESRLVTRLVTGGAMSRDGSVAALRTYTEAYLYPVADGDLVAALGREPVRVPLPGEAQGEAIAFEPDGALLSASEFGDGGTSSVVRSVSGAVDAAGAAPAPPSSTAPSGDAGGTSTDPGAGAARPAAEPSGAGNGPEWLDRVRVALVGIGVVAVFGLALWARARWGRGRRARAQR